MAIFQFTAAMISAGKGHSAVRVAAYRHSASMTQQLQQESVLYEGKNPGLFHSEITAPDALPAWANNAFGPAAFEAALAEVRVASKGETASVDVLQRRAWARVSEQLWNAVEDGENRMNKKRLRAAYARSLLMALPKELLREDQIELIRAYIRENFAGRGMVADWVMRTKKEGNPHAFVMLTTREIDERDWNKKKQRDWNARSLLLKWRASWAEHANLALERAGFDERIDHRSYEERGIKLESETYHPHVAEHAERSGSEAREKARVAEVRDRNRAYLCKDPEHILAVLRGQKTSFTRDEILGALADRLGLSWVDLPDEMISLVMNSRDLDILPKRGAQGEQLYAIRDRRC